MRKTMMATLVVMLVLTAVTPELRAAEEVIEPLVSGWESFVGNDSPYTVTRMQLLFDALDGSGRVVAQQISWLPGTLPAFSRTHFEILVRQRAQAYRVRVLAYDRGRRS